MKLTDMKSNFTTYNLQPTTKKVFLLKSFVFFLPLVVGGLLSVSLSHAAFEWEVPLPPAPGGATLNPDSIDSLFTYIYNFALGLGGLFAFFQLVRAGILWSSEGSGISAKADAKNTIINTIFGLLLLLFSWVILNTINPQILNLDISVSKTESGQQSLGLAQGKKQTLAGVFDSLSGFSQRQSLDDVIRHISQTYLVQTKPDVIARIDDPKTLFFEQNLSLQVGLGRPTNCKTASSMSLNTAGIPCIDSLSQAFNCYTPLACSLINDLVELKTIVDFQVLTGSDSGSHAEKRAVDIVLYNLDAQIIDPRDQTMVYFLNSKKSQCGDELFAPAKFGESCYFMSNGEATSTCSFLNNQIHYSTKSGCV